MQFEQILRDFHIHFSSVGPKCRQGWINLRCPQCHKDPYLGYNLAKRYTHCWNCGSIPLWTVLRDLTQLRPQQIFDLIGELPRDEIVSISHTGKLELPYGVEELGRDHQEYIRDRRLSPLEISRTWKVKGIGQHGSHRWRLFIPVEQRGEVVSWTTRSIISGKEPRYLSARPDQSKVPIENCLYGVSRTHHSVCVVEGPIDTWTIGPGAVAILGLRTSPSQLEQLSRFPVRYICFDREEEAQRRARKLRDDLSVFPGKTANILLEAKDPGSASREEINHIRGLLRK
jgi:hypothetical protein